VGEDPGVVDAVVVEPGQRGQPPRHRRGRSRSSGPGLGLRAEVADPQVDVVPLGRKRVHAELCAPAGPGLDVAPVGGGGVGRVAEQPARGESQERVVAARASQPVQRPGPDRGTGSPSGASSGVSTLATTLTQILRYSLYLRLAEVEVIA
jgi:hypothetical protein